MDRSQEVDHNTNGPKEKKQARNFDVLRATLKHPEAAIKAKAEKNILSVRL